ncbi:LysR family transcriptional regulator [Piscinibacter sp. HJYY11]|uniref:LysR substrate-binding domain-containing protein n=1 Tax=Piscinibacter sp. HJYY11 TaxID=2801333 RepID=UPI00191CF2ED|nr:LysR family transcriptional regulator [Piscinibacter sp. HJYY11]MBL0728538.1 LysR family transcriptional regulator [Piscinibacter sp. HJYY11]
MDRFDALRAFARVVEAGSFTKAAQTLHLSKTTVTQLVQQLESRLRVRLLHRTTRRVAVTVEGAAYYQRVVRLLDDLDEADSSVSSALGSPKGRLRVDVPSPIARLLLMPALPAFHTRYPEIQIDMGVSDRRVDVIGDHVDCVLRGGEVSDLSLSARRVGELALGVYAAPAYLARAGHPDHPAELQDPRHHIVGYLLASSGTVATQAMQRGPERVDLQGRYVVAVDDGNAYLAAGLAGMGVLCLPTYMADAHERRGALHRLFADWQLAPMPVHAAWPQNRYLGARLRVFIDWVAELMARHAPLAAGGVSDQSAR